ncbi:hypothetical protein BCR44DRAFT_1423170 [Catenaria anguillulae PL171]|uniref:Uncharacterized protein n=1 Tax=Catenaria anguillulae PL171 TaxID=765915 RepID=A0A1Y2I414_9FUNG|nr:hypothetical protein BCR44DRAFT_1423170 [Catenaria anguillulae PL171]
MRFIWARDFLFQVYFTPSSVAESVDNDDLYQLSDESAFDKWLANPTSICVKWELDLRDAFSIPFSGVDEFLIGRKSRPLFQLTKTFSRPDCPAGCRPRQPNQFNALHLSARSLHWEFELTTFFSTCGGTCQIFQDPAVAKDSQSLNHLGQSYFVCSEPRPWTATFGPLPYFFQYDVTQHAVPVSRIPEVFETEVATLTLCWVVWANVQVGQGGHFCAGVKFSSDWYLYDDLGNHNPARKHPHWSGKLTAPPRFKAALLGFVVASKLDRE